MRITWPIRLFMVLLFGRYPLETTKNFNHRIISFEITKAINNKVYAGNKTNWSIPS